MREETKNWWMQAKDDMSTAEYNLKGGKFQVAAFLCQQAVEKAFKALLIERTNEFPKIHDLVRLGKLAGVPEDILENMKELTSAYVYSRYPDVNQRANLKEKVSFFLTIAKEALQWVEENL